MVNRVTAFLSQLHSMFNECFYLECVIPASTCSAPSRLEAVLDYELTLFALTCPKAVCKRGNQIAQRRAKSRAEVKEERVIMFVKLELRSKKCVQDRERFVGFNFEPGLLKLGC